MNREKEEDWEREREGRDRKQGDKIGLKYDIPAWECQSGMQSFLQ